MEAGIAVALVTFVAAMVQTAVGFGFALLAVPTLAIFLEPAQAIPISAILSFLNATRVAGSVRRYTPWRVVLLLLVGSVVGLPFGLQVLLHASAETLRFLVGATATLMAFAIWRGLRWSNSDLATLLTGFVSGILSTSTAINGPPVVLHLQAARLPPPVFRAAISSLFVLNGLFALGIFFVAGLIGIEEIKFVLIGLPFLLVGHWGGNKLLERLDANRFRGFVLLLLGGASASIAIVALVRLL